MIGIKICFEQSAMQTVDEMRYVYLMFPILFLEEMIDALLLIKLPTNYEWVIMLFFTAIIHIIRDSDIWHEKIYLKYFKSKINEDARLARILLILDMVSFCESFARAIVFFILLFDYIFYTANLGNQLILFQTVNETRIWAIFVAAIVAIILPVITNGIVLYILYFLYIFVFFFKGL